MVSAPPVHLSLLNCRNVWTVRVCLYAVQAHILARRDAVVDVMVEMVGEVVVLVDPGREEECLVGGVWFLRSRVGVGISGMVWDG